jgi:hypothetical protein
MLSAAMMCVVAPQKNPAPRNTNRKGRHCTVDLLIKIGCLEKGSIYPTQTFKGNRKSNKLTGENLKVVWSDFFYFKLGCFGY